ncbi:MAG: hypothetical protein PUF13_03435 [Lachnospiraceae bacterium]|nr:hypothetical protein [Lachnospiraceae bacterium]
MITEYLKKVGYRRILMMFVGNVILSVGVSIFKLSRLGNDPFSGMIMALSDRTGIGYAEFLVMVNLVIFVIQFIFGKHLIGAGTLVNAFLNGYMMTFFYELELQLIGRPSMLWQQVVIACAGMVICSLGISLYQTPDVGVAPYDSLSLIMADRCRAVPYFWDRICTDAICALLCWKLGGIVGLGTVLCAFGFGPIIHFFNEHVAEKLLERPTFRVVRAS